MILYNSGAEHTSAAYASEPFIRGGDDDKYHFMFNLPHPDNLRKGYGLKIAHNLKSRIKCESQSGGSNTRIIRMVNEYLKRKHEEDIFILIGWAPWDREEWVLGGRFFQAGIDGIAEMPLELQQKYSKFLKEVNIEKKEKYWHNEIWKLHNELASHDISHLFFNESSHFTGPIYDWGSSYFDPYSEKGTFCGLSRLNGHELVAENLPYYAVDAHLDFAHHLIPYIHKATNDKQIR